jgi:DNA polymerase-3 subunit alpha
MRRGNLRTINKKVIENLANAGAFDSFEQHRAQYFAVSDRFETLIEHSLKYGAAFQSQKESTLNSLFGAIAETVSVAEPAMPNVQTWSLIEKLTREKDVTGIFLSGHPLDDYRMEIDHFTTCGLDVVAQHKGQKVKIAGFVTSADHRISQKGTGWGRFVIEDFKGTMEITMFSEDYLKFKHLFEPGSALYIQGEFEKRWNSEEFNFKPKEVRQLASIGAEMTDAITVKVATHLLTKDVLAALVKLCADNKGKHTLKINLIDHNNRQALMTVAKNQKVNADGNFISELQKMGLDYKLN